MKKIAIIGAGASGIFCSIMCSQKDYLIDIYEQNTKCAKKILVSGNGRCNVTNTSVTQDDFFTNNSSFVKHSLEQFPFSDFQKFCSTIGLEFDIKNDGKVYPLSNEAKSVANLLENHARSLGVNFHTDTKITQIQTLFEKYDAVVVACGSEAASHLGGNTDGQKFASEFGHTIIPSYPSLVQLELHSKAHEKMSGAKVDGAVTLLINSKPVETTSGDILFTNYGVSGFAILDISQKASENLLNYQVVDISLNLLPKYTSQSLSSYMMKLSQINPRLSLLDLLHGLLPLKIVKTLLEILDLAHTNKISTLNTKLTKRIANQILNWRFEVKDTHGFRHAEVAGGGVDTTEINPLTMESLKRDNLYFIGEVLDVVGRRGGFNFTWAWASAFSCAKDIRK